MRVLVVEDDARIAADVCKALRAAGYVIEDRVGWRECVVSQVRQKITMP